MSRRKHDFYPTAARFTEDLLRAYPEIGGLILEPCSGAHDMSSILDKIPGAWIRTNDIDPERVADSHLDARSPELYSGSDVDWVVTNPPFSHAMEILKLSHAKARIGISFLVRLSFLEPTLDRGPWFVENPPDGLLVLPRYSFTQNGKTDSVTCAWVIWRKQPATTKIAVIPRTPKS